MSYDKAYEHGQASARIMSAFIRGEISIAKALEVPKESWEVQKLLRIPNWFVGSNLQSYWNLKKIVADTVAKTSKNSIKMFLQKPLKKL